MFPLMAASSDSLASDYLNDPSPEKENSMAFTNRPRLPHFVGTFRIDGTEQIPKNDGSGYWLKVYATDMASGLGEEMSCWDDQLFYTLAMQGQIHDLDFSYNAEKGYKTIAQIMPASNPPQAVRQATPGGAPMGAPPMQAPPMNPNGTMAPPMQAPPMQAPPMGAPAPAQRPPATPQSRDEGQKRGNALNVASGAFQALVNSGVLRCPDAIAANGEVAVIGWATLQLKRIARNVYGIDPSLDPDEGVTQNPFGADPGTQTPEQQLGLPGDEDIPF